MKEIWKPIKNYEGLYEISNYGRVKSLAKEWMAGYGTIHKKDKTILIHGLNSNGYFISRLYGFNKKKTHKAHLLVWDHFGDRPRNGRILQVDHIDENKLNNRIDNLQLLTARQNSIKYHKTQKKSSEYAGVHWNKSNKKWVAQIQIDKKHIYIGCFNKEIDAHNSYQKALKVA